MKRESTRGWTPIIPVIDGWTGMVSGGVAHGITMLGCEVPLWLYPTLSAEQQAPDYNSPEPITKRRFVETSPGCFAGFL